MITKELLSELRKDFDRAIEEVGHKYSLSIDLKGISYSDTNASGKIEMSLIQPDGVLQTKERSSWQSMASTYGLDPDLLDKTFVSNGVAHTVAGINMKLTAISTATGNKCQRLVVQPQLVRIFTGFLEMLNNPFKIDIRHFKFI